MAIDGIKHDLGQTVRLQQTPKLQQRGGVRCGVESQINADKPPNCLAVVERIFRAVIGQAKALLENRYAQHSH